VALQVGLGAALSTGPTHARAHAWWHIEVGEVRVER
jgi:hypothetical protein